MLHNIKAFPKLLRFWGTTSQISPLHESARERARLQTACAHQPRCQPDAGGERLFSHVAIANEQLMLGEQEILKDKSLESGLVTIGASETALRLFLLNKLELFPPQLSTCAPADFQSFHTAGHPCPVARHRRFFRGDDPDRHQKPLHRTSLFILSRNPDRRFFPMPLLLLRMQSLHDLLEVPFISLGAGTGTRELYSQYFLSHHLVFSPDMEASTTDQILPMVAHNLGIGFYPEALASEPIARGEVLPIRLVEPIPEREICLIRDTSRPKSIAAQKLMEHLQAISETAPLKCFFWNKVCACRTLARLPWQAADAVCKALFTSPRGAHPRRLFCVIGMKFPITQEAPVFPPVPASRAALRVVS